MKTERIKINNIPSIIWGEKSNKVFVAVHGNMSNKEDDVIKNLNRIKELNHNIYIITGRKSTKMKDTYNETLDWLKMNDIPFDELIIEEKNKGKACLENNIDVYVDDSVKHLKRVQDIGIKYLFIFDNVYNIENKEYNRIYSFDDLYYNIYKLS